MAYTNLKQEIDNYVYENHENEILGKNLQKVLKDMVDVLGDGYRFMGVARTNTTIPTPEEQVFYLVGNGEYGNFGSTKTVPLGYIGVMYYDTQWNMSLINLNLNALNLCYYEGGSSVFSNRGLARQSVPTDLRHKGLIISYVANGIQYCELCINSASATWGDDASWYQIYPFNSVSVSQNTSTGHTDITVGDVTIPVASVNDINNIEEEINEKEVIGENNTSYWLFNYFVKAGVTYKVKLVSGDGNNKKLAVGSSTIQTALTTGEWKELTPAESGQIYMYLGAGALSVAPQLIIFVKESIADVVAFDCRKYRDGVIFDKTNPFFCDKIDGIDAFSKAIVGAEVFGAKDGFSYFLQYFSTDPSYAYRLFYGAVDKSGNYIVAVVNLTSQVGTADKIIRLVAKSSVASKAGGTLELSDLPETIAVWVDFAQMPSGTTIGYASSNISTFCAPIYQQFVAITSYEKIIKQEKVNHIIVNRNSDPNANFTGLSAISNALNSITDASAENRYVIHVKGEFRFTDPLTLTMAGGDEYSAILMKPYVDIEGEGSQNSIIAVDFPANANFHTGKTYNDYQPIYFLGTGGTLRDIKVEGKNCRYVVHFENGGENGYDKTINVENCDVISHGCPDYTQRGFMECFGTGMSPGQVWNIKNSKILNDMPDASAFAIHTPLIEFSRPGTVNLVNCVIRGQLSLHNYQVNNNTYFNMMGCTFAMPTNPEIRYPYYVGRSYSKNGDYTRILLNANDTKACYKAVNLESNKGEVLRIKSLSTGVSSTVRFVVSSSAFDSIIGNSYRSLKDTTIYGWDTEYGYVYRDGGIDLSGQAFGTIDVDSNSQSGHTLASLLGDCSTNNKQLGVIIDGTTYTITFNENYNGKTNAYVLEKINDIIGTVAIADLFCPAKLYYPTINELGYFKSGDYEGAIKKGMGIVIRFTGEMRRATNADGYIDGICLDDTSYGQIGRVIRVGFIPWSGSDQWFKSEDTLQNAPYNNYGQTMSISTTEKGKFVLGGAPSVLRCRYDCFEIL